MIRTANIYCYMVWLVSHNYVSYCNICLFAMNIALIKHSNVHGQNRCDVKDRLDRLRLITARMIDWSYRVYIPTDRTFA